MNYIDYIYGTKWFQITLKNKNFNPAYEYEIWITDGQNSMVEIRIDEGFQ